MHHGKLAADEGSGRGPGRGPHPGAQVELEAAVLLLAGVAAAQLLGLHGVVEHRADLQQLLDGVALRLVQALGVQADVSLGGLLATQHLATQHLATPHSAC